MTETTELIPEGDGLAAQLAGGLDADQARVLLQTVCDVTWNAQDADALVANLPPDFVMRVVPTGEEARGTDAVRQLAEARLRAFPDWHLEVREAFMAGDRMCAQIRLTGTQDGEFLGHPATGRHIDVEVCCVFGLGEGALPISETVYFDLATMLRQLGHSA